MEGIELIASLAAAGAYLDWRYRRLPNLLCLIVLVTGLGFTLALHGAFAAGMGAIHSVLALLAGMFFFARGWVGGGDAKFYAGMAAWFPVAAGWLLILSVSLAGLVLLLVWYPFRRKLAEAASGRGAEAEHLKLPYGVAIAVGALAAFLIVKAAV